MIWFNANEQHSCVHQQASLHESLFYRLTHDSNCLENICRVQSIFERNINRQQQQLKKTLEINQRKRSIKKRVLFNLSLNKEHESQQQQELPSRGDGGEQQNNWYSLEEYRKMRDGTSFLARHTSKSYRTTTTQQQQQLSYRHVMETAYNECCSWSSATKSQDRVKDNDNKSPPRHDDILNQHDQDNLANVFKNDSSISKHGLEKWAIPGLRNAQKKRRHALVMKLLKMQRRHNNNTKLLDVEIIRQHCEQLSQPDRLFAHCIAAAQAKGASYSK